MIHIIDLHFLDKPETIAAYLIPTSEGPLLVETGPYSTYSYLKKGVEELGYNFSEIRHVLITHIHLDHAGAAWALAEQGATVYLHPFGYKHMHDPSKLVESARRIYKEDMDRLWSDIKGIPEDKLQTVDHMEKLTFGDTTIQAWHTPGHAVHHIAWQVGNELIAGDVGGVKIGNGPVVPPCPPPDIHIENWKESIELIRSLSIDTLYLSHFGKIESVGEHLDKMENILVDWANWIYPHYKAGTPNETLVPLFKKYVANQLVSNGVSGLQLSQYDNANPPWMSVAGLMRYWKKKEEKRREE